MKKVQPQKTKKTNASQPISYAGNVSIKVSSGKKIIAKQSAHNAGNQNLFKFLALSLAGSYKNAEPYRPVKIMLFNNAGKDAEEIQQNLKEWQNISSASNFIWFDSTASIENKTDEDKEIPKYAAILHFRVPFAFINEQAKINQICIYGGNGNKSSLKDYSACYILQEPIESKNYDQNYNIVIEWEMNISNELEK